MKSSRFVVLVTLLCVAMVSFALAGCNGTTVEADPDTTEAATTAPTETEVNFPAIRVGTLPTDDLLPLWVASDEGLLEAAGLDVEIITFQSPQDSLAAITAGEVDALMTDMVVATLLTEGGVPVRGVTTMAGAPAGIVAGADTGITSLADLANVPVAISTPTIIEYTVDKALTDAGVAPEDIEFEVIPALSTRLQMLTEGNIDAAALPWTLLRLAEQQGATVLLDREQADGITSTVLVFSQTFIDGTPATGDDVTPADSSAAIAELLVQWDAAVELINANPDNYRELLIESANLPEPLRDTYPVVQYYPTQLPNEEHWNAVLDWMRANDYLDSDLTYNDMIFQP